jgi:hypothetical protein
VLTVFLLWKITNEVKETFGKLLDSCVVFIGRAYDQGSWIRRSTKDALGGTSGRESPAPRAGMFPRLTSKRSMVLTFAYR